MRPTRALLRAISAMAIAGLALTPPAASAQSGAAAMQADVECLALMAVLAGNEDPQIKNAGTFGTLFFLGKITARDPQVDIEGQLRAAAARMTDTKVLGQRCGGEMQQRGNQLQAAGRAMQGGGQ